MYMSSPILSNEDLTIYKIDGKIMSGGFSVNSILLNQGLSPTITTLNYDVQKGGKTSNLFENLAVPSFLFQNKKKSTSSGGGVEGSKVINVNEPLDNDIHDKLLKIVEVQSSLKERKTRKKKAKSTIRKTQKRSKNV